MRRPSYRVQKVLGNYLGFPWGQFGPPRSCVVQQYDGWNDIAKVDFPSNLHVPLLDCWQVYVQDCGWCFLIYKLKLLGVKFVIKYLILCINVAQIIQFCSS